MWAADHGIDVTNNSYYSDPWYMNCVTDADQKALVDSISRAIRYARDKGVTERGERPQLSTTTCMSDSVVDTSPVLTTSTPVSTRQIRPSARSRREMLPGIAMGVVGGRHPAEAYYSNCGNGVIDVQAPGGDSRTRRHPGQERGGSDVLAAAGS
ncbi:hypothetical protein [Streptomyces sp. KL116D]|uniref:hypothetical protein n=1 Tax=Streptomyces sp. KL116D TaxID=3045152 RepID=UPI003556BEEE